MKRILLLMCMGISSLGFSVDRFQTDAEKNHEDLIQINQNLKEICLYIKQLTKQQKEVLELSHQMNETIQQYGVETWEAYPEAYPAD